MSTPADELVKADTDLKRRQTSEVERTGSLERERFAWEREMMKQEQARTLRRLDADIRMIGVRARHLDSEVDTHEVRMEEMRASVRHMDADVQAIRANTEYTRKRAFWVPILAVATCFTGTILAIVAGIRFINWALGS